jgi:hypothetical protein
MSSAKIVVAIVAIVFASVAGLSSAVVFQRMVEAVNQRLPQDQQFNTHWWYWRKNRRLMAEYRRLCPDRTLEGKYRILVAAAFVSLLVVMWAMGFFRW